MAILSFSLASINAKGQFDPFSLARYSPMVLNQANFGYLDRYTANFNYRSEIRNEGNPFIVSELDLSRRFDPKYGTKVHFGLGGNYITKKVSDIGYRQSQFGLSTAMHLNLADFNHLSIGLGAEYTDQKINLNNSIISQLGDYTDILDTGRTILNDRGSQLNIGAGLAYHFSKPSSRRGVKLNKEFSFGLSISNLGNTFLRESEALLQKSGPSYFGYAITQIPLGKRIGIIPSAYFKSEIESSEFLIGSGVKYLLNSGDSFGSKAERMHITFGYHIRSSGSSVFSGSFFWSDYRVSVAYDTKGISNNYQALEIALFLRITDADLREYKFNSKP